MRLLLYIRISQTNLELPPAFIQKISGPEITVADLDNQSSKEVIQVTAEAIKRADKCGVLIDIRDVDASVETLYPIFKALLGTSGNVTWLQNSPSALLEKFRLKASGKIFTTDVESATSIILSFLTD